MHTLPLSTDIVKYVLSDYIPHDELGELQQHVRELYLNPARTTTTRVRNSNNYLWDYHTRTDGKLSAVRKLSDFGCLVECTNYDTVGNLHGTAKRWYCNGQLEHEYHYVHGTMVGLQRQWDNTGDLICSWIGTKN